jgi:TonB family protein
MGGLITRFPWAILLCVLGTTVYANDRDKVALSTIAEQAVQKSKLTLPGSRPFHLKAVIVETTNPNSEYEAKIEEYWASPTKWKRTIDSPRFSQSTVVNGEAVSEKNSGDYFPLWLNQLVNALVDPLPILNVLKQSTSSMPNPHSAPNGTTCADLHARVDRWVICFTGDGLLQSVFTKGYATEIRDYKSFGDKSVARHITINPEEGTTVEARITDLTRLDDTDEAMFAVADVTPPAERIRSVKIDEDTFRKLSVGSTAINWPPTGGGPATGGCAVYASADKMGNVREVWPEGCDSTGLEAPLREAVRTWHLKPAISDGVPVQVEALLGFTFNTQVDNSHPQPELSDDEARRLTITSPDPVFPHGSITPDSEIVVQISVDETGKVTGVENPRSLPTPLFLAASAAISRWRFKPLLKDGQPQYFHANISFRANK